VIGASHFPDAVELYKVGFNRDVGKVGSEQLSGPQQFAAMMFGLSFLIAFEVGETTIGGAIGVAHYEHALGLVQSNRHADLFEDEVLLEVVARGGESFRSAGDDDHGGALDLLLLQELSDGSADTVVETAEHGGVGYVLVGGGVEMEDLLH